MYSIGFAHVVVQFKKLIRQGDWYKSMEHSLKEKYHNTNQIYISYFFAQRDAFSQSIKQLVSALSLHSRHKNTVRLYVVINPYRTNVENRVSS